MKIGAITLTLAFSMAFAFLVLAGMPPASDAGPCPSTLDTDTIGDCVDNCTILDNDPQVDTNTDGYGNVCDGDFDQTGINSLKNRGEMLSILLCNPVLCPATFNPDIDMDSDGTVSLTDLGSHTKLLLSPTGPSGLACAGIVPCP